MPDPSEPRDADAAPPRAVPRRATNRFRIGPTLLIDPDEILWRFSASGGPGGQHANKTATRAEARFDVAGSPSLTENQRQLIMERVGSTLSVAADDTRSQHRNRDLALERLRAQLAAALERPAPRRPTKPSKAAKKRRVDEKRRRSQTKQGRGSRPSSDD